MKFKYTIVFSLLMFFGASTGWAGRASIKTVSEEPYRSAILLNAETGETLFEKNADVTVYPASTLKLMVLLVILERVEQGTLQLDEMVQVTVEAFQMGGSQVYLDPKEQFSVEDLLYALMIQSANDAAVALATHVAGSKEGFVALMNQKARELGMKNTTFHSVHGLPPSNGQDVDVTTARDFGTLCRYLSSKPEVFRYTSERVRDFRGGEFIMRTHNHLLKQVDGCDGFKTGYFVKAGFSIAATAKRGGVRIIAIVMGSKNRKVRDAKAIELLARGFSMVPAKPEPLVIQTRQDKAAPPEDVAEEAVDAVTATAEEPVEPKQESGGNGWGKFFLGLGLGFCLYGGFDFLQRSRRGKKRNIRIR